MRSQSATAPLFSILVIALVYSGCATTLSPQEEAVVITQPVAVVTAEGAVVTVPTELVSVHPGFVTAWQGTDPAALRVYFADGATVVTTDRTFTGWDDIRIGWIDPVLPIKTNFITTAATFTREGTDVIIESGTIGYRITRDGALVDVSSPYTYRWQRQADGTWRLVSVNVK